MSTVYTFFYFSLRTILNTRFCFDKNLKQTKNNFFLDSRVKLGLNLKENEQSKLQFSNLTAIVVFIRKINGNSINCLILTLSKSSPIENKSNLSIRDSSGMEEGVNERASCAGGREFVSQRSAKSYTALQTVRHRFNIYVGSCVALALLRENGHANSLHASASIMKGLVWI